MTYASLLHPTRTVGLTRLVLAEMPLDTVHRLLFNEPVNPTAADSEPKRLDLLRSSLDTEALWVIDSHHGHLGRIEIAAAPRVLVVPDRASLRVHLGGAGDTMTMGGPLQYIELPRPVCPGEDSAIIRAIRKHTGQPRGTTSYRAS